MDAKGRERNEKAGSREQSYSTPSQSPRINSILKTIDDETCGISFEFIINLKY